MQTYRLKKQRDRNGFYQMIDETDRMFTLLKKKKQDTRYYKYDSFWENPSKVISCIYTHTKPLTRKLLCNLKFNNEHVDFYKHTLGSQ